MNNINDTFFDGYYKEIWRTSIPQELTVKEVDFMIPFFDLKTGSKVLDMMCGYGRHAIALAKKGMNVTAVDNLYDYIEEIKKIAEHEKFSLKAIQADVIDYKADDTFDLVVCMGNSLNFFDLKDTGRLIRAISSYLKPGGHLLVNTWSLAETVIKNFTERSWSKVGEMKFLAESKFLFHPTRIETESTIIAPDCKTEIKTGIDYIFSINEMEALLKEAGLNLKEIYSVPGKKKFSVGDSRAYIIAQKP
ncbi:MAG: class I SAM-dependent methyltransferase, partial [Bacteroidia bacterium]|nr:class I SAM-dependent methyltransferase [Bacteroidia bacterium]